MPASWTTRAAELETLELAFKYFETDRIKNESVCNWSELKWARQNKASVISGAQGCLDGSKPPDSPQGWLYSWPKSRFVSRRLVQVQATSAIVRMALAIVIGDDLDPDMIETSFANRRATGGYAKRMLLSPWARTGLPDWNNWKRAQLTEYGTSAVAAITDFSAFYDMVSHRGLMLRLAEEGGLRVGGHDYETIDCALRIHQEQLLPDGTTRYRPAFSGLATGGSPDALFSNVFLTDLDREMARAPGVRYSRYCDDIFIIGDNAEDVQSALDHLQRLAHLRTLTLNARKTDLRSGREDVEELIERQEKSLNYYYDEVDLDEHEQLEPLNPIERLGFYEKEFSLASPEEIRKDPRGFCKFVSMSRPDGTRLLSRDDRLPDHVNNLAEIARKEPQTAKHAAWLIVESFICRGFREDTAECARAATKELLADAEVQWHAKARILHHLAGRPRGERLRASWLQKRFTASEKKEVRSILEAMPRAIPWGLRTYVDAAIAELDEQEA